MFSPLQGNRTWCAKLHALWLCPWSWCAILRMKFYDSKYYIKINYMISLQKAQWIFLKPKGAWKARCPERCLQRGLLAYYSVDVKTVSGMLGHFVFWARTWVNRYSRPLTRTISHQIAKKSPEILRFQDFVGCGRGTWTPDLRVMSALMLFQCLSICFVWFYILGNTSAFVMYLFPNCQYFFLVLQL